MTLLDEWRRETHWSNPQRLKEAVMTMPALAYPLKSKYERLEALRQCRDELLRGARFAQTDGLRQTCRDAASELSNAIGRITIMTDESQIGAVLDRILLFATRDLGRDVRKCEVEARMVGVDLTPMRIVMACSDT